MLKVASRIAPIVAVDIYSVLDPDSHLWAQDSALRTRKGMIPLTPTLGSAQARPRRKQERRKHLSTTRGLSVNLMSRGFRGISSAAEKNCGFRYSTILLTQGSAPFSNGGSLLFQDRLLAKIDHQLPFSRHIVCTLEHRYIVENPVVIEPVGTQEVVISNPESQIIIRAFRAIEAVCLAI